MEMQPHPVPVILRSHERSDGLSEAFRRPGVLRGSTPFLLQGNHTALYGDGEPRKALLFAEELRTKRVGWLLFVNFLVCAGAGGVVYGVYNNSGEAALKWFGASGTLLGVLQGLLFWLLN